MNDDEIAGVRSWFTNETVDYPTTDGLMPSYPWVFYFRRLLAEVERLQAENAALREIVEAVAHAETYHAEVVDKWVLLFDNPTLSYAQEILVKARALLGA